MPPYMLVSVIWGRGYFGIGGDQLVVLSWCCVLLIKYGEVWWMRGPAESTASWSFKIPFVMDLSPKSCWSFFDDTSKNLTWISKKQTSNSSLLFQENLNEAVLWYYSALVTFCPNVLAMVRWLPPWSFLNGNGIWKCWWKEDNCKTMTSMIGGERMDVDGGE